MSLKWDLVQLKCGSCGGDLRLESGPWGVFYQCEHHDQTEESKQPCYNRMNSDMYELILNKIQDLMLENQDIDMNFTGYKWQHRTSYQHFRFRIQKQSSSQFVIQVANMKKCNAQY